MKRTFWSSEFSCEKGYGFGSVQIGPRWITVGVIVDRFLAGEIPRELAEDYDMPLESIHDALRFWMTRRWKAQRELSKASQC